MTIDLTIGLSIIRCSGDTQAGLAVCHPLIYRDYPQERSFLTVGCNLLVPCPFWGLVLQETFNPCVMGIGAISTPGDKVFHQGPGREQKQEIHPSNVTFSCLKGEAE